jgi:hypothetical protein
VREDIRRLAAAHGLAPDDAEVVRKDRDDVVFQKIMPVPLACADQIDVSGFASAERAQLNSRFHLPYQNKRQREDKEKDRQRHNQYTEQSPLDLFHFALIQKGIESLSIADSRPSNIPIDYTREDCANSLGKCPDLQFAGDYCSSLLDYLEGAASPGKFICQNSQPCQDYERSRYRSNHHNDAD